MSLKIVVNRTDEEISKAKIDDQWIDWRCHRCNFSRPVRISDLLLTTACPRCK